MAPKTKLAQGGCLMVCLLFRCDVWMAEALDTTIGVSHQVSLPTENSLLQDCTGQNCPQLATFPQFMVCVMSFCDEVIHDKRWLDTGYYSMFPQSTNPGQCVQQGCEGMDGDILVKCQHTCHKLARKRDWLDPTIYNDKNGQGKRVLMNAGIYGKREEDANDLTAWIDPTLYTGGKRLWVDPTMYGKRDWIDPTVYGGKNGGAKAGKRVWVDPTMYGKRETDDTVWTSPVVSSIDNSPLTQNDWLHKLLFGKPGHDAVNALVPSGTEEGKGGAKKWLDPMTYRSKRWLDPMIYRNNRAKPTPKGNKRSVHPWQVVRSQVSPCQGYLCVLGTKARVPSNQTSSNQRLMDSLVHCLQTCSHQREGKDCAVKCEKHTNDVH